jgi:hypothetical protein
MSLDSEKVTVIETWRLKPEYVDRALEIMQEMDDIVSLGAHDDPDWCEHAKFYQRLESPNEILMVYPWRRKDAHERLTLGEGPLLADFVAKYCERDRVIEYLRELPVDVEGTGENRE